MQKKKLNKRLKTFRKSMDEIRNIVVIGIDVLLMVFKLVTVDVVDSSQMTFENVNSSQIFIQELNIYNMPAR